MRGGLDALEGNVGTPARRTSRWPLVVGALVGFGLLGSFLWNLHWAELSAILGRISWTWLAVACGLMLLDYVFHAIRWWILIRQVDHHVPLGLVVSATAIGTGMNTLLPFRAGAFIRPGVIAARRDLSYTTLLATTLAEAICDLFGVVGILLWMVWYLPTSAPESPIEQMRTAGKGAVAACIFLFAGLLVLRSRRTLWLAERVSRSLPSGLAAKVLGAVSQFAAGVEVLAAPHRLAGALVVTLGVWVSWALALLATFRALALDLPLAAAVLLEAILAVEMMVPQAPGFLGGFQHFTVLTLSLFDITGAPAEAVALVFWVVCFVPVTVWGVVEGWRQGFGLLTTQKDVAEAMR